jgi:drug/metabolite transporter (DMT)-like permease
MLELRCRDAGVPVVMSSGRLTPRLAVLLTLPPLLWAGNAVVGRMLVGSVPPVLLNALRWAIVLLILLPLGRAALATPAARQEVWARRYPLALLGVLGVGCYNALQYLALTTSTPVNVTLIAASLPAWMMAIGAALYGVRPAQRELLGALLSVLGVLLVLLRGDVDNLAQFRFVGGDLLMLAAVLAWAFYSWLLARPPALLKGAQRPVHWGWAEFLLLQSMFGLVWCAASAGVEAVLAPQPVQWSGALAAALLYVALGPSLIAYRCWGIGVAAVGPALPAFFGNLTPLFAALLSAALLGEAPRPYHALAFVLIVAGIAVSSHRR